MIATFTYGVFFFGVPHRGSALAKSKWVEIAADIFRLCGGQLNKSFLNSIETGSAYNEILNTRFEPLFEKYRFYSFCEGLEENMKGINPGIVGHYLFSRIRITYTDQQDCRQTLGHTWST
jgi:hypothetical protein